MILPTSMRGNPHYTAVFVWHVTSEVAALGYAAARKNARRRWRRSWVRKRVAPEVRIVVTSAAVITLIVWGKRLTEQFLGQKWFVESIFRGEANQIIHEAKVDVETGAALADSVFPRKGA